jgi:hypothetical protein
VKYEFLFEANSGWAAHTHPCVPRHSHVQCAARIADRRSAYSRAPTSLAHRLSLQTGRAAESARSDLFAIRYPLSASGLRNG